MWLYAETAVLLLLLYGITIHALVDPLTAVASSLTVAGVSLLYKPIYCQFRECCDPKWLHTTAPNLRHSLETNVFGQHLAIDTVVKSINSHFKSKPSKALALSFQGWTGTGKNLVARLIAESLYENKAESGFVHWFSATKHFSRPEKKRYYQDQIRDWIEGNLTLCPNQLFIFDEIEKMPEGVLDTLKPFVDFTVPVRGVEYRKAIYILLGNAGSKYLFDKTYQHFRSGGKRQDLRLRDTEATLWKESYYEQGGLRNSSLIKSHLISAHIPFLPLERSHVISCIHNEINSKNYSVSSHLTEITNQVLAELTFTPANELIYSTTGCKRVYEKVNLVIEDYAEE
ncbi:TOR1A [Bugula neritina]|uniref:TOR1A n=1 Tax=Bugula neritina TaxID=10212 RepID=A0A7J7KLK8_BUGNE|nr:TOR1A [Bugula neritina]